MPTTVHASSLVGGMMKFGLNHGREVGIRYVGSALDGGSV